MSFKDTFTKDDKQDEVEYDEAASYTFFMSILLVIMIPLIYKIIKRIFLKVEIADKNKYLNCDCKFCKERLEKHVAKKKKLRFDRSFYIMIFSVLILGYILSLQYNKILENNDKIKSFSPHDILEVSTDADERTIKKAYRRLSLKYHPDKNPNNLQAKAKFIMINKAYESLTDPVARENYQKYGNPDGPGSMRLGVALPSFILNKKNHIPILVLFLIFIVILVPLGFTLWYNNSKQYDEMGLQIDSTRMYYELLNENVLHKHLPYVVGVSREFSELKLFSEEVGELNRIHKGIAEFMPKPNAPPCQYERLAPSNQKAICLIYAYLKKEKFNEYLRNDLNYILSESPEIIEKMVNLVWRIHLDYLRDPKHIKAFGLNCMKNLIEFDQMIHQQLWLKQSPFLQLPEFTEERLKIVVKNNAKVFKNFKDFLKLPLESKKQVLQNQFDENQINDIHAASSTFPLYESKLEAFVEEYEEFLVGDLITLKLTIDRTNYDEKKKLGVLHSNTYPEIFKEKVYAIFRIGDKVILDTAVLTVENKITVKEFKYVSQHPGKLKLSFEVLSLNFKGLDETIDHDLDILLTSEKRKAFVKEIEKREPKKLEPSLFQQMLSNVFPNNYQDSDDEEEEEKKEDAKANPEKPKETKDEPKEKVEECCDGH